MSAPSPRVLLLHGLLGTGAVWRPTLRYLDPAVEVVTPDLPGYGEAPGLPSGFTLPGVLERLATLVDYEAPTHVVGHSMGAIFALALAARFPGRFGAVGLIGLPVFPDRAVAVSALRGRSRLHGAFASSDSRAHLVCAALHRLGPAWLPLASFLAPRRWAGVLPAVFDHCAASHAGAMDYVIFKGLVPALAGAAAAPVHVLHGGADRTAPLPLLRELAARYGWDVRIAPTAGHELPVDRPALVARWIRDSLLPPR